METIKTKIVKVKLKDLVPNPKNEKIHTQENLNVIKASIEKFGYVDLITVDENLTILAGHGRTLVLNQLGYEDIEVKVIEGLTEVEKDLYRIYNNQSSRTGYMDDELILHTIKGIVKEMPTFNVSVLAIEGLVESLSEIKVENVLESIEMEKVSSGKSVILLEGETEVLSDIEADLKNKGITIVYLVKRETKK